MLEYLPQLQLMLFAPTDDDARAFVARATDLADLERRDALLDEELRRNLQPTLQ